LTKKPILWVVWLAIALVTVACGSAAEPTAAPPAPQLEADESEPELAVQPTDAQAPSEPTGEVAPEEEGAEPEPVGQAAPAESAQEPRPHRTAPASPGAFVSDQAQFVGATGSPQLVEFFTYW
jgi:cytoskeletal protein RodZ